MPGWLTTPRNPLMHKMIVIVRYTNAMILILPCAILTCEVVEAVAMHQSPVPVAAVCVVSHHTHLVS